MAQKLQQQLRDVGSKLENPPASKDALIKLLKHAANSLCELDQSPLTSILESMQPCLNAIVKPELLKHHDRDVRILVATCICEITRITAPEAPYSDDVLRDIFHLIVGTLSGLSDINSPSFGRRVLILETLARYKSCVVMLDLECNDLIIEMFGIFFSVVSDDHPESVLKSMQTIMILILDESEDVLENLLFVILSILGQKRSDVPMAARKLAMNVIEHCAEKLEPSIKQFLVSSMSGDRSSLNSHIDYHEVIYDIYQCAPQILSGIIPYITGELLTDQLDIRMKAIKLLGKLFSLPGLSISESFQPLFSEFLKRLADRVVEVRLSVIEHVKNCLISNPFRDEAPDIISALCDRLLDYDENVRRQVVAAVYDVACHDLKSIPIETATLVAERLRDKSLSVKRYTMERLAELYRLYCLKSSDGSMNADEFGWIPGKILRCLYDKDFRSETIEVILCDSLFPPEFSIRDKVKHWVTIFTGFDKVEVKALEQLLTQKQRLQQEMQKYLTLRQTYEDGDVPDLQKRISSCFRVMSRLFNDPAKAEESFLILNQVKDANIWKILTCLLDPCSSFRQSWTSRDDLLRILGEKHPLFEFMGTLSMKCSYLLFNKEYVKEILSGAAAQKSSGNTKLILACMNLLAILANFSPFLLTGSEEDIVHLLKEDNEVFKEGIAHVLAKAGGTIREQLAVASSSVDLLLERLCLEGSRKQAKYAVHALAAITKDDGLKSLSVLYKRIVDMLEEKTHLPAILQSLGCIAQTAMPVFETREGEIINFITRRILECSNKADSSFENKTNWNERSEHCLLKVYGIKTLVKSFLPIKDAHLRLGIEKLLDMLKNILSFGEISKDIESSTVDRSHMMLAAAKAILRLSKQWDHKIPVDIFYLTLRTSQDINPECRKLFLNKIHQYLKERSLDAKYACAFLFNIMDSHPSEFKEAKQNLVEVVHMCHQVKSRQISSQCDVNSLVAYPENILSYLVHALSHHSSCPNFTECKDVQAFEPIYLRLYMFLSVLLFGDEESKPDITSNRTKENFSKIVSILHSIKCSEDVVDGGKSKNSHAICDLGISICKQLVRDQTVNLGSDASVPLPGVLYKPLEKSRGDDSMDKDDQMWLSGDSIVAHFESLKFEDKEKHGIGSDDGENETVSKDSDKDGTEVPLGKIMEKLKSQGAKKKKIVKKQALISKTKTLEQEVDILGMVREINLDTSEKTRTIELNLLDKEYQYALSGQTAIHDSANKVLASHKKKKNKNTSTFSVQAPKRKRSSFMTHSKAAEGKRKSSEGPLQSFEKDLKEDHAEVNFAIEKDEADSTDSDLLASCLPSVKNVSGTKRKDTPQNLNGTRHTQQFINNEMMKSTMAVESVKKTGIPRSFTGAIRKRKRSIAGLTKCTAEKAEKSGAELVGCRIKVWWPMDKEFYEGAVQSYDLGKKKHVILYDDGDVEVLQLDKEKWELVSTGYVPRKKLKRQHLSSSKELLAEKDGSRKQRNSIKKVRKKATQKRYLDHDGRRVSETKINADLDDVERQDTSETKINDLVDAQRQDTSDLSDAHPHAHSDVDDFSSDGSSGKRVPSTDSGEKIEQNLEVLEESTEVGKSESPSSGGNEDSDDEPLSAWKQRAGN